MAGLLGIFLLLFIIVKTIKFSVKEKEQDQIQYYNSKTFTEYELDSVVNGTDTFRHQIDILKKHVGFYNSLSELERIRFANRTFYIRQSKDFYGMENLNLTPAQEIMISATLATLTFGLGHRYELPTFEMIQVYPAEFYSRLVENDVKGLTLGNGRIFLSWKHFNEGVLDDDDKVHLGLHEFAHAMMIEFDHFNQAAPWENWLMNANPIMAEVQRTETHFFREYGGTNIHEFWAVVVETFFEQPHEFKKRFPPLYTSTSAMLNQDLTTAPKFFNQDDSNF